MSPEPPSVVEHLLRAALAGWAGPVVEVADAAFHHELHAAALWVPGAEQPEQPEHLRRLWVPPAAQRAEQDHPEL